MWATGENTIDTLEETFLTIGKENKSFIDERLESMALDDIQKQLQEPEPIVIVFGIDNSVSEREQTTIGIDCSCSEKNAYN